MPAALLVAYGVASAIATHAHASATRATHATAAPAPVAVTAPTRDARPSTAIADSIRGTVLDTAGRPLRGASVTLGEANREAAVGPDGTFLFADVPNRTYTLVVTHEGYSAVAMRVTAAADPVTVVLRPTSLRLAPVTVTATRSASDPLSSPLSTAEISGEQLRREQQLSLAQAIDNVAGIRALTTGEQVGKPVIHGLTGPRVLVLDNGLRLEDFSWSNEDGPSADSRLAERIEVIRGPASVLYGSDAVGGVVNIVPREVPDARGRSPFARGAVETYAASNNSEIGGVLRAEGARGALGWRGTLIGRRAGNFRTPPGNDSTPTGKIYNTQFRSVNGDVAVGLQGERASGTIRYARYGGTFGLLDGPPVPEDNEEGPLRILSDDRVQGTTNWLLGSMRLETKSQWQRHALRETVGESRIGSAPPIFDLLLNSYSTDVLLHHAGPAWLRGTVGVSGLYQNNRTSGAAPLVPDARVSGAALFALEQATAGKWSATIGARGDLRRVAADSNTTLALGAQSRNTSALSGNFGVVYRPVAPLAITANTGRSFRAPSLFELFTSGPRLGEARYEIGIPGARAEVGWNSDVGFKWEGARFRGSVDVYRNRINDYLYIQPTGTTATVDDPEGEGETLTLPVYRYVQTARAVIRGVDVSGEMEPLPTLTLRARFDALRGDNVTLGSPLPLMPPARGDLSAELHTSGNASGGVRAYFNAGTQMVARQSRLGPFDSPTGAYTLLNLGAGASRRIAGRMTFLDVRAQNVTNARYADFLSRYKLFAYGRGRSVLIRISTEL